MARSVLEDPRRLSLPPVEAALAGLAWILSEAPWTLREEDLATARAAGLSEAQIAHAIAQAAFFNYLNRVADGTGVELDYDSPLPPPRKDAGRAPMSRPEPDDWPRAPLRVTGLPEETTLALARWRAYALEREAPLTRRDRRVLAAAVARGLCDADGLSAGIPETDRERALAAYATKLTILPWSVGAGDLGPLRAVGLDDAALLDAISVISAQNTLSRLRFAGLDPPVQRMR